MLNDLTCSKRFRAGALTLAFGVVAGGAALVGAPAMANPTETPVATPVETDAPITGQAVAGQQLTTDKPVYTMDEFLAGAVNYAAVGFTPNTAIQMMLAVPDGTTLPVEDGSGADTADAEGNFSGALEPTGTGWPEGEYTLSLASGTPGEEISVTFYVGTPPVATPEPTPTETTAAPAGSLTNGVEGTFTQTLAATEGIQYVVTGFTPSTTLGVEVVFPDGSIVAPTTGTDLTTDGDGIAARELTYTGTWPVGSYTIVITDPTSGARVEIPFTVVADASTDTSADAGTDVAESVSAPQLAATGVEADFGPAGLALAALVAGAGAIAVSRRLAK